MTMKSLAIGLVVASFCSSAAFAGSPTYSVSAFHKAKTDAEKTLDSILTREKNDAEMNNYLVQGKGDAKYAQDFTPAFKGAVVKEQARLVKKNCGGKDKSDEVCGLDFSPVNCAQDVSDTYYLYKTLKSSAKDVTIAYAWPKESEMAATYRLHKDGANWKIDGVKCGADGHTKFNFK